MSVEFSVPLSQIAEALNLTEVYVAENYKETNISTVEINRPGLELTGYLEFFDNKRIQVLGNTEFSYLGRYGPEAQKMVIDSIFSFGPPAVIICRDIEPSNAILESAKLHKVSIFSTPQSTSDLTASLVQYLNKELAPRITRHGVLVEVYGEGCLLTGDSGVGKSETAIELIKRGHRLVADDAVEIRRTAQTTLYGQSPENIRHFIELLGNGSNVLVPDEGIHGTVLRLDGDFRNISLIDDTTIYCGAGAALGSLCKFAQKCGLSGLEFAWGIPGTVDGALFMNAGAYGGEMKDVVYSVSHITQNGDIGRTEAENLEFGYRTSVYRKNGCIITGAVFKLKKDDPEEIQNRMNDYMNRRSTKQPLEYPSAGSVFKRPEGAFAGALIEQCGLKGKTVGGAQVSEKHAGFIINKSKATADDVKQLVSEIQKTVENETGYKLECELIFL
jgi:UDP-N-acetylmuramate dehydrogenase